MMKLSPPNEVRPTSAWQDPRQRPKRLARGRPEQLPAARPFTRVVQLEDPPAMAVPQRAGPSDGNEALQQDVRPAPPTAGVKQQCTTVQLVGGGNSFRVVIDGQTVGEVNMRGTGTAKFWLPRYREVQTQSGERKLAAPVCFTVRTEEGEAPPLRATVRVRQRSIDHGTVVTDARLAPLSLPPHDVADLEAPYVLLPYPATITTPPHALIGDAAGCAAGGMLYAGVS